MPASRALRRHHLARLKQRRRHDLTYSHTLGQNCTKSLGKHVSAPKPCSCWICGNPRKFYGNGKEAATVQEKRADAV